MEVKIEMRLLITDEDIEDIIDMAGYGIAYWAQEANIEDKVYVIIDEDEKEYRLAYDDIAKGISLYIKNGNKPYNIVSDSEIDTCQIDAVVADMIIQYACFEELIYG